MNFIPKRTLLSIVLAALPLSAGHAALVIDQESSDNEWPPWPYSGALMQAAQAGQSFNPTLQGVDFIRLKMGDGGRSNSRGATVWVELRADSPTGPLLSSTDPVMLVPDFLGVAHFSFPETVGLTPGSTYYFEPKITAESDAWFIDVGEYGYPGGTSFRSGIAMPGGDLWFREGIGMIPEPSSLALLALGLGGFALHRRMRASRRR